VAALLLALLGSVLAVPGGWGMQDMLGWPDGRRHGAAQWLTHL
jgi:hypothetical protein